MKYLAVIHIDDLEERRFLEEVVNRLGKKMRLAEFRAEYRNRFQCNPSLLVVNEDAWVNEGFSNVYVPLETDAGRVWRLGS